VDPRLAFRLAGLVDGEGCFTITKTPKNGYRCAFVIKLRADDREMLERYRYGVDGIGHLRRQERKNAWAPTVAWQVEDKYGVGLIRDLFELYPLWSKKRRDFEIWAPAVDFWIHCVGYATDWTPVVEAKAELHEVRKFMETA
jgi:hypothetical protein